MNKTVWITGTASGLGKFLARELSLLGFDVVGFLRPPCLQDDLPEGDLLYERIYIDLSEISACRSFLREYLSGAMAPWLVIHNASILPSRKPVWEESWEEIARAFSVNVHVPLLFSSQLLLRQIESNCGGGHLFISSGVGRKIRSGWGSYGISKLSIEAISQSLASDLPEPFFSATLNPGKMRTKMRRFAYPLEDPDSLPPPSLIAVEIARFVGGLFESGGREINGAVLAMTDIVKMKSSGRGHDGF